MIETHKSIQLVHDTSTSFLFHASEPKMKTEIPFHDSKQKSIALSDANTSMQGAKPNPKCQCFKSLSKAATVQWGNAYVYLFNVDPKEIPNLWYNNEDLQRFQKEKRQIVKIMKRLNGDMRPLEGTQIEIRGFENYQSLEFNRRMRLHRQEIVEKVLNAQRQCRGGRQTNFSICSGTEKGIISDCVRQEDDIANESRKVSEWSRNHAYQRALKDQNEIQQERFQEWFENPVTQCTHDKLVNGPKRESITTSH